MSFPYPYMRAIVDFDDGHSLLQREFHDLNPMLLAVYLRRCGPDKVKILEVTRIENVETLEDAYDRFIQVTRLDKDKGSGPFAAAFAQVFPYGRASAKAVYDKLLPNLKKLPITPPSKEMYLSFRDPAFMPVLGQEVDLKTFVWEEDSPEPVDTWGQTYEEPRRRGRPAKQAETSDAENVL